MNEIKLQLKGNNGGWLVFLALNIFIVCITIANTYYHTMKKILLKFIFILTLFASFLSSENLDVERILNKTKNFINNKKRFFFISLERNNELIFERPYKYEGYKSSDSKETGKKINPLKKTHFYSARFYMKTNGENYYIDTLGVLMLLKYQKRHNNFNMPGSPGEIEHLHDYIIIKSNSVEGGEKIKAFFKAKNCDDNFKLTIDLLRKMAQGDSWPWESDETITEEEHKRNTMEIIKRINEGHKTKK